MGACVGFPEGTATSGHGSCSTPLWLACNVQLGVLCGCFQRVLHLNVGVGWGVLWNSRLSILCKEKVASELLIFPLSLFFCLPFSIAVCSERQKGEPTTKIAAAFQTQRWCKSRIPNARLVVSPLFNFTNSKQRNSNYICKLPGKAKQLEG